MVVRFDSLPQLMFSSRMMEAGQSRYLQASSRLSSGLRVQSGADDAAGLRLASGIQAKTVGWQQAQRNIQDGISIGQVADGGLSTLGDLVRRMRDLAVQSANGVYDSTERQAMQNEVSALRQNIVQVINQTRFNGINLLQGQLYTPTPVVDATGTLNGTVTYDGVTLTGGSGPNPALAGAIAGTEFASSATKSGTYEVQVLQAPIAPKIIGGIPTAPLPASGAGTVLQLSISGPTGSAVINLDYGSAPATWVGLINAQTGVTGVSAALVQPFGPPDDYLELQTSAAGGSATVRAFATTLDPLVAPEDYVGYGPAPTTATGQNLIATINGQLASVSAWGTTTTLRLDKTGDPADGLSVGVTNSPYAGAYTAGPFPASAGWVNVETFATQTVDLQLNIQSGPNGGDQQALTIKPMTIGTMAMTGANTVGTIDISTQAGAQSALDVTNAALDQINNARTVLAGDLASLENALQVAASGDLSGQGANSKITNADAAAEAADLAKAQIQTQAAAAAASHINADAAGTLQLITSSRVGVLIAPTNNSASSSALTTATATSSASGGVAGLSSGAGAPSGGSFASTGVSMGAMAAGMASAGGGSSSDGMGGFSASPVTPGFSATPVTPGFNTSPVTPGYTALPVLGSGGAAGSGGLSSGAIINLMRGLLA